MPRVALAILLTAGLIAGPLQSPAGAVSIEELFGLKANGLSDDVLIALIESDGSIFQLTSEDVLELHKKGLGEKVILAMLATARRSATSTEIAAVQPPPIVIERIVQIPAVTPEPAPPPPVQSIVQRVEVSTPQLIYVPVAVPVAPTRPEKPRPPVYWGFGGKPRPGSWRPAPDPGVPSRPTMRPAALD